MKWMKKCYSRLLIDNHITDLKPEFMRRFDPAEYVRMVKTAGVDSAMIYAGCHNGNCYYPTKVGHMHANLDGRDIFGETVAGINAAGITPIAYYTIVFHNDSAKNHQAWRMQDVNGKQSDGRYWYSCINNPDYVNFVKQQLSEISVYPVAGIFIDMTFWPLVCHCQNCRSKYRAENGREIPLTIDWSNPDFSAKQCELCEQLIRAKMQGAKVQQYRNFPVINGKKVPVKGWAQIENSDAWLSMPVNPKKFD